MRRIAIISIILIFSAMLTSQTANASPECPVALNNLGCIADFDPNPHGGGGGRPYSMLSLSLAP
jgi:hypothetical protein